MARGSGSGGGIGALILGLIGLVILSIQWIIENFGALILWMMLVGGTYWAGKKLIKRHGIKKRNKIATNIASAKKLEEENRRLHEQEWKREKERLSKFISVFLPNELTRVERKISVVATELEQAKRALPVATSPHVSEYEFTPFKKTTKRHGRGQMNLKDIESILTPNLVTWSETESDLIGQVCKYPVSPPSTRKEKHQEFPLLVVELKSATFECDSSKISPTNAEEFFPERINEVEEYNDRKNGLLKSIDAINFAISEFNKHAKLNYEKYLEESRRLDEQEIAKYNKISGIFINHCTSEKKNFKTTFEGYKNGDRESVLERLNYILGEIDLPSCVPHTWDVDFDPEQGIAIVEIGLPDVVHNPPVKLVSLKSGVVEKDLNQSEKREIIPNIHPALILRIAYEVFRNDISDIIKLLVVNGWIKFDDPATGINTKTYTASLMVEKEQIISINLSKIEPLVAFSKLKGTSAGKLVEIIPVAPVMNLEKKDKRFIATKEVLNNLGSETNLASMDWQDFESLIAELFEKEFAKEGAEVKVTQASRDRGVDAVIFDPDPIKGGKFIVQAKRYANTVDVSAVRDLCAVVKKEGASRGILVTTSTYGSDAYQFANNEPVTLLNGAELLGLLKKHGYSFRINLEEARKINLANLNSKK